MRDFRLRALDIFLKKPLPTWGGDLSHIDFAGITYYPQAHRAAIPDWTWCPKRSNTPTKNWASRRTSAVSWRRGRAVRFRSRLSQPEEPVEQKGVLFLSPEEALDKHPELVKNISACSSRRATTSSPRSTARCGSGGSSFTCRRACAWIFLCRRISASTPRTWASSNGR